MLSGAGVLDGFRPKPRRAQRPPGPQAVTDIQGITLRKPPCHYAGSPYVSLTARTYSPILIQKNSVFMTLALISTSFAAGSSKLEVQSGRADW